MLLGRTTSLDPSEVTRIAGPLGGDAAEDFIEMVEFHQVVPQVRANLEACAEGAFLRSVKNGLTARLRRIEQEREVRDQEVSKLLETASTLRIYRIKGAAIEPLYVGAAGFRQMADVDLLVPSFAQYWELLAVLIRDGYRLDKVRLGNYFLYGQRPEWMHAVSPATKQVGDIAVDVDLHVGLFPGCGECLVRTHAATDFERPDSAQPSLSDTDAALILFAHVARQGFLRLRDLNDLVLMMRYGILSRRDLFARLRELGLTGYGNSALAAAAYLNPDERTLRDWRGRRIARARGLVQLFERKHEDRSAHHDHVQFYWSRVWQMAHLYQFYKLRIGRRPALARSISALAHLLRWGRPYSRRHTEEVDVLKAERVVVMPIAQVDAASRPFFETGRDELALLRPISGIGSGLFISPSGTIFARANYEGTAYLRPDALADLHARFESEVGLGSWLLEGDG